MQYLLCCEFTFLSSHTWVYWQHSMGQAAAKRQGAWIAVCLKWFLNGYWKCFYKVTNDLDVVVQNNIQGFLLVRVNARVWQWHSCVKAVLKWKWLKVLKFFITSNYYWFNIHGRCVAAYSSCNREKIQENRAEQNAVPWSQVLSINDIFQWHGSLYYFNKHTPRQKLSSLASWKVFWRPDEA